MLQRASPIFAALLHAGQLHQPTLRLLWSACSTKSATVASVASSLLSEVLSSRRCPEALQESSSYHPMLPRRCRRAREHAP